MSKAIQILKSFNPSSEIVVNDGRGYFYTVSDIKECEIVREGDECLDDVQVRRNKKRIIITTKK